MTAYYNEHDPHAAAWLRNLIAAGLIAPGVVDERDIRDVLPSELRGYTQCHFFAGIGVWSYALRQAGWPDDRPVWTGSCPCQPFSTSGRGGGFTDERHLWPHWHHLIRECHPRVVFGEQVASADGLAWLDLVSADMEGEGYAFWPVDMCAAGVTVDWEASQAGEWLRRAIRDCADPRVEPLLRDFADWARGNIGEGLEHIRQRLFFVGVADTSVQQLDGCRIGGERGWPEHSDRISSSRLADDGCVADERLGRSGAPHAAVGATAGEAQQRQRGGPADRSGVSLGRLDHHHHQGSQGHAGNGGDIGRGEGAARSASAAGVSDGLANGSGERWSWRQGVSDGGFNVGQNAGRDEGGDGSIRVNEVGIQRERTSAPHSFRRDSDWLFSRDGKWRPVESGTFPLAHDAPARVGRLRAYGNAIVAEVAITFIETYLDHERDLADADLRSLTPVDDFAELLA
jgi:DNA (cytosine-5)-methyltransferase 1